jgi:hypothetical protein
VRSRLFGVDDSWTARTPGLRAGRSRSGVVPLPATVLGAFVIRAGSPSAANTRRAVGVLCGRAQGAAAGRKPRLAVDLSWSTWPTYIATAGSALALLAVTVPPVLGSIGREERERTAGRHRAVGV